MQKVRLYACSMMAGLKGDPSGITCSSRAHWVMARSEEEALGLTLKSGREYYKESEGYYQHQVSLLEVPMHIIESVYDYYLGDLEDQKRQKHELKRQAARGRIRKSHQSG